MLRQQRCLSLVEPVPGQKMFNSPHEGEVEAALRIRTAIAPGGVYFFLVFAVGFVLGAMRVTWFVPRLGERWAELLELPLMGVAIWFSARYVVHRFALPTLPGIRWSTGCVGLLLLIGAELGLVLVLQGRSLAEYIGSRDPVSGTAYIVMLFVFAAAPWLLTRLPESRTRTSFGGH